MKLKKGVYKGKFAEVRVDSNITIYMHIGIVIYANSVIVDVDKKIITAYKDSRYATASMDLKYIPKKFINTLPYEAFRL